MRNRESWQGPPRKMPTMNIKNWPWKLIIKILVLIAAALGAKEGYDQVNGLF